MVDIVYQLLRACDAMEAAGVGDEHILTAFRAAEKISADRAVLTDRDGRSAALATSIVRDAAASAIHTLSASLDAAERAAAPPESGQMSLIDWLREVRGGSQDFV